MSKFLCSDLVKRDFQVQPACHLPFFGQNSVYILTCQEVVRTDRVSCLWLTRLLTGEVDEATESNALNGVNHSLYECLRSSSQAGNVDEPMDVSDNAQLDVPLAKAVFKAMSEGRITVPHSIREDMTKMFAATPALGHDMPILECQEHWLLDSKMREAMLREYEKFRAGQQPGGDPRAVVSSHSSVKSPSTTAIAATAIATANAAANASKTLLSNTNGNSTVDTFWAQANAESAAFWAKPINMANSLWPSHNASVLPPMSTNDMMTGRPQQTANVSPSWALPNACHTGTPDAPTTATAAMWQNPNMPSTSAGESFWQNPNATANGSTAGFTPFVWQNPNAPLSQGTSPNVMGPNWQNRQKMQSGVRFNELN